MAKAGKQGAPKSSQISRKGKGDWEDSVGDPVDQKKNE